MKKHCPTGKVGYETFDLARAAAAAMADRKAKQGNPIVSFINAYGCACGKYHIGKTNNIDWSRVK